MLASTVRRDPIRGSIFVRTNKIGPCCYQDYIELGYCRLKTLNIFSLFFINFTFQKKNCYWYVEEHIPICLYIYKKKLHLLNYLDTLWFCKITVILKSWFKIAGFLKNMLFFLKKKFNHFISLIVSFFKKKILLLGQSNKLFPMKS